MDESARLEQILVVNEERRAKILEDCKRQKKEEEELNVLKEKCKEVVDRIPFTRQQYTQTKQLVEELEKNDGTYILSRQEYMAKTALRILAVFCTRTPEYWLNYSLITIRKPTS